MTTILIACVLLAFACAALALGLITGREKKALSRHGCHHSPRKK